MSDETKDAREDKAYALGMLAALRFIPCPPVATVDAALRAYADRVAAGMKRADELAERRLTDARPVLTAARRAS